MKTRKILALVLIIVMLITVVVIPSAVYDALRACATLGILRGESKDITDEYLSSNTTRAQGFLIVLRLKGLETTAKQFNGTNNFNDVADLNMDFWRPILAYTYAHPELGCIGDGNGNFRPSDTITGNELAKLMLEALGYKQGVDFEWADVKTFAESKGLTVKEGYITNFDLADTLLETIKLYNKEGKLFADELYERGILYGSRNEKARTESDTSIPYAARTQILAGDGYVVLNAYDQYGQAMTPPSGIFTSSDTTKITVGEARPGINPARYVYCDAYGESSGVNTATISYKSDDGAWDLQTELTITGKTEKKVFSSVKCNLLSQALLIGKTMRISQIDLRDSNGNYTGSDFKNYYYEIRRLNEDNPYGTNETDLPVFEITRDKIEWTGMNIMVTAKRAGTETLRLVACKGGSYGSTNPNYTEVIYDFTLTAVEESEIVGCKLSFTYDNLIYAGVISDYYNCEINVEGLTSNGLTVQLKSTFDASLPDIFTYRVNKDNLRIIEERCEIAVIKTVTEDTTAMILVMGSDFISTETIRIGVQVPYVKNLYMYINSNYIRVYAFDNYGKRIQVPEGTFTSSDTSKIITGEIRVGADPLAFECEIIPVGDGPHTATISYVSNDGLLRSDITITR